MSAAERAASMSPDELIAVIERGLTADERAAKAWLPFGSPDEAARAHGARHSPGRVLADVESKRAILAEHYPVDPCDAHDAMLRTVACGTLIALARPYLAQEAR